MLVTLTISTHAAEQNFFLDKLSDYNLTLVSQEKYLYKYIGNNDGLSINFIVNEKDVVKIIYNFSNTDKAKYSNQIAQVTANLMPENFEKSNNLSQQLLQKMQLLKKEKNNEILRVGGIRYDIQLLNGMINIQASPNKYYGKF